MINLFISQPMKGKSEKEIQEVREAAIDEVRNSFGEEVNVIDSFIKDAPDDAKPLWWLGKAILLMSKADAVYFARGWREARGCVIENVIANEYGLITIQTN
jgi:hypothetical protein